MDEGDAVMWPPATIWDFLRKFPPILISNIIWHSANWYPFRSLTSPSNISKSILTFFISLHIASHHKWLPFCWSNHFASPTISGTRILNLWVRSHYLDLNLAMIISRFFDTCGTHHMNAGLSESLRWWAYSATWTGISLSHILNIPKLWIHISIGSGSPNPA